jgi:hypothetical protein
MLCFVCAWNLSVILLHLVNQMTGFLMATIFTSSDTALLNSIAICFTTVATLNLLYRGKLFTLEAQTDYKIKLIML